MTLTRLCEGCKSVVSTPVFLQVGIRAERTTGGETQDAIEEWWGDYCVSCVKNGAAVADLLKAFTTISFKTGTMRKPGR